MERMAQPFRQRILNPLPACDISPATILLQRFKRLNVFIFSVLDELPERRALFFVVHSKKWNDLRCSSLSIFSYSVIL